MAAFKWTGAILVLFSAGGLGNLVCHAVERAAEDAGNPEADDIFLKRRDYIQPAPLAEALERVGETGAGTSGGLFEAAAEGIYMQEGESLQEIWKRQVMNLNTDSGPIPLEQEDLEQLAHLGSIWGIWMWTCRNGP